MRTARWFAALVLILLAVRVASLWIGPFIKLEPSITALGLLLVAYAIVGTVVAVKRRRLAHEFSQLSPEAQAALRTLYPELRYIQRGGEPRRGLSVRTVMWLGFVWVNGPVIPWLVGPLGLRHAVAGQRDAVVFAGLLALGFACAWAWWSVNVTLWRRWAARHGIDPDELQWRGVEAGILWPKGHFFQRSELGEILARLRKARLGDS